MTEPLATPADHAGRRKSHRHVTAVPEVQSITNAATAHSDEMRDRMIKYGTTMGIRMVCLVLIFVFDGWFKLVPIIGAVVLPWVAVMIANGGSDITKRETVELLDHAPDLEVTAPTSSDPDEPIILLGEIVPNDEADPAPQASDDDGEPEQLPEEKEPS